MDRNPRIAWLRLSLPLKDVQAFQAQAALKNLYATSLLVHQLPDVAFALVTEEQLDSLWIFLRCHLYTADKTKPVKSTTKMHLWLS